MILCSFLLLKGSFWTSMNIKIRLNFKPLVLLGDAGSVNLHGAPLTGAYHSPVYSMNADTRHFMPCYLL